MKEMIDIMSAEGVQASLCRFSSFMSQINNDSQVLNLFPLVEFFDDESTMY